MSCTFLQTTLGKSVCLLLCLLLLALGLASCTVAMGLDRAHWLNAHGLLEVVRWIDKDRHRVSPLQQQKEVDASIYFLYMLYIYMCLLNTQKR